MPGDSVPPAADPADPMQELAARLRADPAALGEPLLVLASGPIPVRGARGAVVALDSRGSVVLVPSFDSLPPGAAAELYDALERLAQLSADDLAVADSAGDLAAVGDAGKAKPSLSKRHSEFFRLPDGTAPPLNGSQKAVVVVGREPTIEEWRDLRADLGPALEGVFRLDDSGLERTPVPQQLSTRVRTRSLWTWVAVTAAVCLLAGFLLGRGTDRVEDPPGTRPIVSRASLVAAPVPVDATHTQWVGQRRIARASDGRFVAVFATAEGLQVVRDQSNLGRSWEAPRPVAGVLPMSMSIALDSADRIHVAFRDAQGIGYLSIRYDPQGPIAGPVLRVDSGLTSPVVDIAVDPTGRLAHVVWVRGDRDQEPVWAAVSAPLEGDATVIASEPLATPGSMLSVLVNVGAGPAGEVVATYRRGDSVEGWFARYLDGSEPGRLVWSAEEPLPTAAALYGAAGLSVDRHGDAHLVLRDNTTYGLSYLRRTGDGWGPMETIVDADATEEIDFPSVSPDSASEVVYAFFQDTTSGAGELKVSFRDPVTGWSQPAVVESAGNLLYPASAAGAVGAAVLLATDQSTQQLNAFRATAG